MAGVTLQINLAPSDARLASIMLPHQVRQCGVHADEVILTLDLQRVGRSREFAPEWEPGREAILAIAEEARQLHPNLRIAEVDRSAGTAKALATAFFGGRASAADGLPGAAVLHVPLFGLHSAANDHVLHIDGDIFLGGGSPTWLREAVSLLEQMPDLLSCSPFPGPPTPSFELLTQQGTPQPGLRAAYRFSQFSTRVFFVNRTVFEGRQPPKVILPDRMRNIVRAVASGRPVVATAEGTISRQMQRARLDRLDFLGAPPGLWALHPLYRSERFYAMLPDIVAMVEEGDLPDGQLGDYELNDSVIDWSDARARVHADRWRA